MGNDPHGAVEHLVKSTAIYPKFVAAHNALGSAYLSLGQNELARGEFSQAISSSCPEPHGKKSEECRQHGSEIYWTKSAAEYGAIAR